MNELIAGTIAAPKDLPADAVSSVGTPNTLPADSAGIVGTPNTVPADGAGIIAAPISLPSQGAAALPRSLTPMVDFDFAAKRYVQDGVAVAFEDIFTYTRASSATFTNRRAKKNGGYEYFLDTDYVGSVTNLLTYSEDFSDSDWVKTSTSVIANTTKNHLGDKTADKFAPSVAASIAPDIRQAITSVIGTIYTFSIYVKAGKSQFIQVLFPGTAVAGTPRANFDVKNGLLGTIDAPLEVAINDAGDGWYKISVSVVAASTAFAAVLNLIDSATDTRNQSNTWAIGDGVYIWGAQVTQSAKALPYVKTLDVAVTKTFAETLRTEYDAATGENLGALIEGGSTNLITRSESFDDAAWSKINSAITTNEALAPDGSFSADLLTEDGVDGYHSIAVGVTPSLVNTKYTFSVFLKAGLRTRVSVTSGGSGLAYGGSGPDLQSVIDLTTGEVITSNNSVKLEKFSDGWYKCSITVTSGTTIGSIGPRLNLVQGPSTTVSYTGDGVSGIYIWGAQCEALPFASSYIRTEGSAVSRSADNLSLPSTGNFDADEYTIAVEGNASGTSTTNTLISVSDFTNSNRLQLTTYQSKSFGYFASSGGNNQGFAGTGPVTKDTIKGAVTYTPNNLKGYFNGELFSTDTSSLPLQNDTTIFIGNLNVGAEKLFGHMGKVSIYAQALTQQEITLL